MTAALDIQAPTMVRNMTPGPATFSDLGANAIEWAGAGDMMGNDVRPVPVSLLQNVEFIAALGRGIFEVEQAPEEVQRILELHKIQFQTRMQAQARASQAALDMTPANDQLMKECVGPAANGRGNCGTAVPIRQAEVNKRPPLCQMHIGLAGQFVPQESDERVVGGKAETIWAPIRVAPSTRQD